MRVVIFSCKKDDEFGDFDLAEPSVSFSPKGVTDVKWAKLPPFGEKGEETLVIVASKSVSSQVHSFAPDSSGGYQAADVFWCWIERMLKRTSVEFADVNYIYLCHHRGGGMACDIQKKSYDESEAYTGFFRHKRTWCPNVRVCDVSRHNAFPSFLFPADSRPKLVIEMDLCERLDDEITAIKDRYDAQKAWRRVLVDQVRKMSNKSFVAESSTVVLVVGHQEIPECHALYDALCTRFGECSLVKVLYVSDDGVADGEATKLSGIEAARRVKALFSVDPCVEALVPRHDDSMDLDWLLSPWYAAFGDDMDVYRIQDVEPTAFCNDVASARLPRHPICRAAGKKNKGGIVFEETVGLSAKKRYMDIMRNLEHA